MEFLHFPLISVSRDLHLPALLRSLNIAFFFLLLLLLFKSSEFGRVAQSNFSPCPSHAEMFLYGGPLFDLPVDSPSLDPEMLSGRAAELAALFIYLFDRIISAGLRSD